MSKEFKKKANQEESPEEINVEWLMGGIDFDNRRIEIRGEINELFSSIITRSILKMSEISKDPISIIISSGGGEVYEALSIYDCIRSCPCQVNIFGTGKIMSSAFIVFLAGHNRYASPNTSFMMHSVSYESGDAIVKNHEVQVMEGKRLNNIFLDIMGSRTKRNRKFWYRKILNQDFYCSNIEAEELGIISNEKTRKSKSRIKSGR